MELFTYDALNRIKTSAIVGQTVSQEFNYDAIGNLTSKSDVASGSTYAYPTPGATAVRPHAIKNIPGIGTGAGTFVYDANGNLTSIPGVLTTSWTSFDMPLQLKRGTTIVSDFVYGPEHQRTRQTRSDNTTIIYAGAQEVETKNRRGHHRQDLLALWCRRGNRSSRHRQRTQLGACGPAGMRRGFREALLRA